MKLPDKNDEEMLAELDKAYEYAASVRVDKVRYKRDLICNPDNLWRDFYIHHATLGFLISFSFFHNRIHISDVLTE